MMRLVLKIHARLVVQQELIALQRATQAALHREPLGHQRVQLAREELEIVPAAFLRAIHRRVRVLQQRLRVRAVVGIERDADTAAHVELAVLR